MAGFSKLGAFSTMPESWDPGSNQPAPSAHGTAPCAIPTVTIPTRSLDVFRSFHRCYVLPKAQHQLMPNWWRPVHVNAATEMHEGITQYTNLAFICLVQGKRCWWPKATVHHKMTSEQHQTCVAGSCKLDLWPLYPQSAKTKATLDRWWPRQAKSPKCWTVNIASAKRTASFLPNKLWKGPVCLRGPSYQLDVTMQTLRGALLDVQWTASRHEPTFTKYGEPPQSGWTIPTYMT